MIRRCHLIGVVCLLVGCSDTELPGAWTLEHQESAGALLSVWGGGPDDVWAVGGQVGQGLVLHSDGATWERVETGADQLLSWVYGFHAGDVYAVGEAGLIIHYDGATWRRAESGTDKTLYGVWGESSDDVWIVGGDPTGAPGSAVVLRGSGSEFRVVNDVPANLAPRALFKVYGGPRGVIAVGDGGTVLRYDGAVWQNERVPTDQPIFSLWGRADDDVYAVGGYGSGEVLHFDGQRWQVVNGVFFGRGLSGVFTAPGLPMIAVGADAYVVELGLDGSVVEPQLPRLDPTPQLHGVWGDGAGTTYAVGGDLLAYPSSMSGVIFARR
jgi:hypothetical protein